MGWKAIGIGAAKTWGVIASFLTVLILAFSNQAEQAIIEALKTAFLQIAGPWLATFGLLVVGVILAWLPKEAEAVWQKSILPVVGLILQVAPFVNLALVLKG